MPKNDKKTSFFKNRTRKVTKTYHNTTHNITCFPTHRSSPSNFKGHHKECHLQNPSSVQNIKKVYIFVICMYKKRVILKLIQLGTRVGFTEIPIKWTDNLQGKCHSIWYKHTWFLTRVMCFTQGFEKGK